MGLHPVVEVPDPDQESDKIKIMADKRLRTKAELKRLFTNLKRKGITDDMMSILIDVLWREKPIMRSSGFFWPLAPDATIDWDTSTRTFTISPFETGGSGSGELTNPRFRFFSWSSGPIFHQKYETESIQIPDEEGLYVIYYDTDEDTRGQELTYIKNPTFIQQAEIYLYKTIIVWIYWDQVSKTALYYGDERHGSEWVPDTHWWAHGAFNAIRDYGLRSADIVIGDGSLSIHAQVGVSAGAAWHEDLWHESDGIGSTEGLPILYRTAFGPRFTSKAGFPVTGPHMGRIYFNYGGSLTEADEGRFVLCHLFWTNCFTNPLIAVMGQAQYDSAVEAIQGCADELDYLDEWVPHQTRLLITTLIYETKTEFTNSVRARIVGEMTPESIADIVSEDNIPSLKTGWHPDVLEHIIFDYTEATHSMILDLVEDAVTFYFVKGIKFKVVNDLLFPTLQEQLGMTYIDGNGNSWTETQTKWDEWETGRVKAFALYRNPRLSQTPYLGWRMHNWEMEGRTRGNIIQETGLEHLSGLELSINETNLHEIDVTDGSIRLADIIAEIVHNSGNTFGQFLRSLRARRHWLKTYVDETDPENPVITHEWEYQDTPAANVAALSESNEVVINELVEDTWQLIETTDGDYTAMWLIGTLDYAHPLKWITGTKYSSDLDEAKVLNNPESLLSVIEATQFITDHYEVIARVMIKNITDAPYYELIEINQYEDGEFEKEISDRHVIDMDFDEETRQFTLKRNDNLPDLTVEIPGGEQVQSDWNEDNEDSPAFIQNKPEVLNGEDAYVYIAYASDDQGTGFTTTFNPLLDYIAIKTTTTEIPTPTAADFVGLWKNYKGADGDDGQDGQDASDSFDVYIDFVDADELVFVYNCPAALKFTQQISEGAAATLNPVLNTSMAQFDKLTVTAAEVGLIILKGELL